MLQICLLDVQKSVLGLLPARKFCLVFLHHPKCLNTVVARGGLVCTSSGGGAYGMRGKNAVPEVSVMFQTAPGERRPPQRVCEPKALGTAGLNSRYLNNRRVGCLLKSRSGINSQTGELTSLAGPGAVASNNGCSSSYKFIVPRRAAVLRAGETSPAHSGRGSGTRSLLWALSKMPSLGFPAGSISWEMRF